MVKHVGFSAEKKTMLGQGDHACVLVTHTGEDGTVIRIGHTILPTPLVDDFMALFKVND